MEKEILFSIPLNVTNIHIHQHNIIETSPQHHPNPPFTLHNYIAYSITQLTDTIYQLLTTTLSFPCSFWLTLFAESYQQFYTPIILLSSTLHTLKSYTWQALNCIQVTSIVLQYLETWVNIIVSLSRNSIAPAKQVPVNCL